MKPIECELHEFMEHFHTKCDEDKVRHGSYLQSWYPNIKGLFRDKWIVGVRISVENLDTLLEEGLNEEEILVGCVEYLNIIEQPKRGRRRKNPPYGNLQVYYRRIPSWLREKKRGGKKEEAHFKLREKDDGTKYLSAVLITDQVKNKNFWGVGKKR
jgi:hypothetical protein